MWVQTKALQSSWETAIELQRAQHGVTAQEIDRTGIATAIRSSYSEGVFP